MLIRAGKGRAGASVSPFDTCRSHRPSTLKHMVTLDDLRVRQLGECRHDSTLAKYVGGRRTNEHYVDEDDRVLFDDTIELLAAHGLPLEQVPTLEPGGPRRKLFFPPGTTKVGIVTCGGLCPGLNDVIRGLVMELKIHYGIDDVLGFRNGYAGLNPALEYPPTELTPERVNKINTQGGTILGTSRGAHDPEIMVDRLVELGVDILFVIGGEGSIRGASMIAAVARTRDLPIAVIGIPKTIDNDIPLHRAEFRLPDGVHRCGAVDRGRSGGGPVGDQRDRAGQADGPARRIHRLLRGTGQPPRGFRAHSRGSLCAARRVWIPGRAGAPGGRARQRGGGGGRGRRPGPDDGRPDRQ